MRWKKHVLFSSCFMLLNSLPSILTGIITGGKSYANNRKRRIFSWKWHDYIIKISNYSCVFFHAIISIFNRLILCVSPSVSLSPVVFDSTKWLNESNYSSFCLRAIQKCFHNCCFVWWASISSVDVCVCAPCDVAIALPLAHIDGYTNANDKWCLDGQASRGKSDHQKWKKMHAAIWIARSINNVIKHSLAPSTISYNNSEMRQNIWPIAHWSSECMSTIQWPLHQIFSLQAECCQKPPRDDSLIRQ